MQQHPIHPQIRSEAQSLFEASKLAIGEMQGNKQAWQWALDDFLGLLEEFHDQPVQGLRLMIRRVVIERAFLDHTGDSMSSPMHGLSLERRVDQIVLVLEKVRQHALDRGQWSDQPSPPLMCG